MEGNGSGQKRRSPRSNLLMAATLDHDGVTIDVTLRNLSADGAMVESEFCPQAGSAVTFVKNDLVVPGRIAWRDGCRAGVSFDAALDPAMVLRNVPPPRPVREEIHKRPGFRGRLSAEERRAGESLYGRPLPNADRGQR